MYIDDRAYLPRRFIAAIEDAKRDKKRARTAKNCIKNTTSNIDK